MKKFIPILIILLLVFASVIFIRLNYGSKTIWLKAGDLINGTNIQFLRKDKNLFVFGRIGPSKIIEHYYVFNKRKFKILTNNEIWILQLLDYKITPLRIKLRYRIQKLQASIP